MAHPIPISQDISQTQRDCVHAFQTGNKAIAEQRLFSFISEVTDLANIKTTISKQETRILRYSGNPTRLEKALEIELAPVSLVHLAAYWGWKTVLISLVSAFQCATADYKDELDHNPLHYASYKGRLELVKYFVEELHCNPLDGNDIGDLALHYACSNGHLEVAQYLIKEKHCDPSCENQRGNTPLHYACQNGHLKIAQYLIEECDPKCNPSCKDKEGNTPLHFACHNCHLNIVKYLIRKGCNPSCESIDRWTPLHFACGPNGANHFEIVKYLVDERQCNPSCKNKLQFTPFHEACRNGHLNIAKYFFSEKGCDPAFGDEDGTTPLHFACMNGHLSIVRYLIGEKKCDPSYADNHRWTPLHYACSGSHAEIVQYLLSTRRVNLLAQNNEGFTALYYAKYEIMKIFQESEKCTKTFSFPSTNLFLMEDSKADFLNTVDVYGETVLEVVGDKPQTLKWSRYGFIIEVPEGALPPGVTASVCVRAILGGKFKFPENSQLISALYWVSSSEEFLKEVAVSVEHCAIIETKEQCSSFRFIISKTSTQTAPYTFRERKGEFNPHTQYGTIKLKRFCVISAKGPADTETQCIAHMYYKKKTTCPFVADFHFVVVKDLKSSLQVLGYKYQCWSKDSTSLSLCFKSNTVIQLQLDQEEQEVGSWKIVPLILPLEVTNRTVCRFAEGATISHCSFELRFERCCGLNTFQRLFYRVNLLDETSSSAGSFCIRYPPHEDKTLSTMSTQHGYPQSTASHDSINRQHRWTETRSSSVNLLCEATNDITEWHDL